MAPKSEVRPRPKTTQDLVLRTQECTSDEAKALRALCQSMITIFHDKSKPSYVAEAATISSIKGLDLSELIIAISNMIVTGTSDENIKEPEILQAFTYVLRHAKESSESSRLGTVLGSLAKRLKPAKALAETQTQYELVCCLSALFDAMVDIKVKGIGRELIHTPLTKALKELQGSKELRLAQAASYAHAGLLVIPDDEEPWHAAWRHIQSLVNVLSKTAGAVTTMDPTKLLSATPDLMNMVQSVQPVFENISEAVTGAMEGREVIASLFSKQKRWYRALRYTDLLLRCKAWGILEDVVSDVPCRDEKDFLCGLYAQLESTWKIVDEAGDESTKEKLVELLERLRKTTKLKEPVVQEWANAASKALGQEIVKVTRSGSLLKQKGFQSNLKLFAVHSIPPNLHTSSLLDLAWKDCTVAKLFYADAMVRKFYTESERLHIERLSGERLAMDSCYINLAIQTGRQKESDSSFELAERADISFEDVDQILLEDFFKLRKMKHGNYKQPRRLFIQGRAGVGKTTLCKKIVYEHLHGLWSDLFDRILWLPLRRLKGKAYNLKRLIHVEYFNDRIEDEELADCLARSLAEPAVLEKTLFLLDGLDEVSQEWGTDSNEDRFLHTLLQKSWVITTSRPQGTIALDLDLELETIGFLPSQVKAYIEGCVDQGAATRISEFLRNQRLIRDLARIPIQLDALCYCWAGIKSSLEPEPSTMTTLYESVTRELWRKDYLRWSGESDHKVRGLRTHELYQRVEPQQTVLEWLAFQGMRDGIIDFTPRCQEDILSPYLSKQEMRLGKSIGEVLDSSSFLRTSYGALESEKSYHFLHLTFQEYFAARYFVRRWSSQENLEYVQSGNHVAGTIPLKEFIQRERYNSRYHIFWGFVAGLVQIKDHSSDPDSLEKFFSTLNADPGLLGSVHHRLICHCIHEVLPSTQPAMKILLSKLEGQVKEWVLLSYMITGTYEVQDTVFPYQLIPYNVIKELCIDEAAAMRIVRPGVLVNLSPSQVRDLYAACPFKALRISFLEYYRSVCNSMTEADLSFWTSEIMEWLEDSDRMQRYEIVQLLSNLDCCLPAQLVQSIRKLLDNDTEEIRSYTGVLLANQAFYAMRRKVSAAGDTVSNLDVLENFVSSADWRIRVTCVYLVVQDHSDAALSMLLKLAQDPSPLVRRSVASSFFAYNTPDLGKASFDILVKLSRDGDVDVRISAARAMLRCLMDHRLSCIPTLDLVAELLRLADDSDVTVRQELVEHGGFFVKDGIPEEAHCIFLKLLKDPDPEICIRAAEALMRYNVLPETAVQAIAGLLKDPDPSICIGTAKAMVRHDVLKETAVRAMTKLMDDPNAAVCIGAARVLLSFNQAPAAVQTLVKYMTSKNDLDSSYRMHAIDAFRGFNHDLPDPVASVLTGLLKDSDRRVCQAAVEVLFNHKNIPQEAFISMLDMQFRKDNLYYMPGSMLHLVSNVLHRQNFYNCWPLLEERLLRSLCFLLIRMSMEVSLVCEMNLGSLFIIFQGKRFEVSFNLEQRERFRRILADVKKDPGSVRRLIIEKRQGHVEQSHEEQSREEQNHDEQSLEEQSHVEQGV